MLCANSVIRSLILTSTQWGRYYYTCFTGGETKAHLVSRIWTKSTWLQRSMTYCPYKLANGLVFIFTDCGLIKVFCLSQQVQSMILGWAWLFNVKGNTNIKVKHRLELIWRYIFLKEVKWYLHKWKTCYLIEWEDLI